jgi:hypothetical protein
MQAPHCLAWNWLELETIVIFALPVWLVLDVGLLPVRK